MSQLVRRSRFRIIILAVLSCLLVSNAAHGGQSESPRRLRILDAPLRLLAGAPKPEARRVIIRTRAANRVGLRRLVESRGGSVVAEHASVGALTAVIKADQLAALAELDEVVSISTDAVVTADGQLLGGLLGRVGTTVNGTIAAVGPALGGTVGAVNGTVSSLTKTAVDLLNLTNTAAGPEVTPRAVRDTLGLKSSRWTGRGVGVAVIDSGIEMSAEFQGRITAFYDFTNGRALATTPSDEYGHGTHVASLIGGSGALGGPEYRGIAPSVRLVGMKVLDANGGGLTSDVIRAVDYAVANRETLGIDIINLSLGHPIYEPAATDPLVQAVERATRAGLIVVASAGNMGKNPTTNLPGYAGVTSPGNAPSAITVGALRTENTVSRSDDRIPDYSSSGPTWYDALVKPDVLAPGHNLAAAAAKRGTIYKDYPQLRAADADYVRLSGTSMAAAVASGVVALAVEAHADADHHQPLTANATKAVLQYTAFDVKNDLGLEYDPLRQGAGGLNGDGAIELARSIDTSAAPGTPWLMPAPLPWTSVGNETLAWKQAVIWGNAVIWGSTVPINQAAWSNAVIWGSNITWGEAVIWGSNVIWSDSQSWGNAVIWGSSSLGTSNGNAVIWGSNADLSAENVAWQDIDPNAAP